jgi:hypothetical protein
LVVFVSVLDTQKSFWFLFLYFCVFRIPKSNIFTI